MCGSAIFTTVISRMIISCAPRTTRSAMPGRLRRVRSARACRGCAVCGLDDVVNEGCLHLDWPGRRRLGRAIPGPWLAREWHRYSVTIDEPGRLAARSHGMLGDRCCAGPRRCPAWPALLG